MGFADVALSEIIAEKLGYEASPGIIPDNSFAPSLVTFPGDTAGKKSSLINMANNSGFTRRTPDIMTEELCAILSQKITFEFKPLYDLVYANLHARNAASGGDEMLRLRAYEKLQNLVHDGMVKKTEKKYRGNPAALLVVSSRLKEWRVAAHQRTAALRAG